MAKEKQEPQSEIINETDTTTVLSVENEEKEIISQPTKSSSSTNLINEFETELSPGLWAGQKLIPIQTAGCYVPGGRYAHVASAIMSITTARVAGVENIIACSAPKGEDG